MLLLSLTVSCYKFVIRRPEAQRAQANAVGLQQEKAGAPLQLLHREMPLIVVQPNEEVGYPTVVCFVSVCDCKG